MLTGGGGALWKRTLEKKQRVTEWLVNAANKEIVYTLKEIKHTHLEAMNLQKLHPSWYHPFPGNGPYFHGGTVAG